MLPLYQQWVNPVMYHARLILIYYGRFFLNWAQMLRLILGNYCSYQLICNRFRLGFQRMHLEVMHQYFFKTPVLYNL